MYQDGNISPLGVITLRCPECGIYEWISPPQEEMNIVGEELRLESLKRNKYLSPQEIQDIDLKLEKVRHKKAKYFGKAVK